VHQVHAPPKVPQIRRIFSGAPSSEHELPKYVADLPTQKQVCVAVAGCRLSIYDYDMCAMPLGKARSWLERRFRLA